MRLIDADALKMCIVAKFKNFEDICTMVDNQRTATDTNVDAKWIPVSERLPNDGTRVIVFRDSHIEIITYWQGSVLWGNNGFNYEVIAWMPLPEPYKESESE